MSRPDSRLTLLRKRWWVVLLVTVASVVAGGVLTARQVPIFRASASLVVAPNTEVESATDLIRSLETLERRTIVATFAKIPLAPEIRNRAAQTLGSDVKGLRGYRIVATVQPYTNIVRIEVTGPNREMVASAANAVAEATQDTARSMYRIYSMKPLASAVPPSRPVYPDSQRNYLLAAIVGFGLGIVGALLVPSRTASQE